MDSVQQLRIKAANHNNPYKTVSKDAKPEMFRSMQEAEHLIIDAINIGLAAIHKAPEEVLKDSVLGFIKKHSFLGFMTALPTTADFITYESVYLPKNHFIKEDCTAGCDDGIAERICGKI